MSYGPNEIIFKQIVNINNFVFSITPCNKTPYRENAFRKLAPLESIQFLLNGFAKNTLSGWCSLNAEFFSMILKSIDIPVRLFSYGIKGSLTHATAIATIGDDEYLFDPYFNRYYTFNNKPLTFKNLMLLVQKEDVGKIVSVYGPSLKFYNLLEGNYGYMDGKTYESKVINNHIRTKRLNEILLEHFGNTNIFNLMKINWR